MTLYLFFILRMRNYFYSAPLPLGKQRPTVLNNKRVVIYALRNVRFF